MNDSRSIALAIKAYAKEKKIQTGKMLIDCGINKNALSTMQSRGTYPGIETITKIADYLNCSVDYLLGRTEDPESHLSKPADPGDQFSPSKILLDTFEKLSEGDQYILIGEAKNLLHTWEERSVAAGGLLPGKEYPSCGTEGHSDSNEGVKTA